MKTFFNMVLFALSSVLLVSTSFASTPQILVQVKTQGGFVPPSMAGHENGITVYDNGMFESFARKNSTSPLKRTRLGQLSPVATKKILEKVHTLKGTQLVAENPEAPSCVDAPSTDYTALNSQQETVVFSRNAGCQQYYIEEGEARSLSTLLDGLRVLQ